MTSKKIVNNISEELKEKESRQIKFATEKLLNYLKMYEVDKVRRLMSFYEYVCYMEVQQ